MARHYDLEKNNRENEQRILLNKYASLHSSIVSEYKKTAAEWLLKTKCH